MKIVQTKGNYSDENPILARELVELQPSSEGEKKEEEYEEEEERYQNCLRCES